VSRATKDGEQVRVSIDELESLVAVLPEPPPACEEAGLRELRAAAVAAFISQTSSTHRRFAREGDGLFGATRGMI
jgi:hypothetical protein